MAKVQSIKICVVGDETVGKTSLLTTYTTGKFPATYVPTTFANFGYNLVVDGKEIYIDFWDTIELMNAIDCAQFGTLRLIYFSFVIRLCPLLLLNM